MYERPNMTRQSTHMYPAHYESHQQAPKQYPTAHSSSSAFSASANPNEDWTKISDLAERRRIQNRIAQRNYRKKLKKRLEDLERRAGSSSASPEQRAAELARPETKPFPEHSMNRQRSASAQSQENGASELIAQHYVLPSSDDRGMFSQQYTRQLSTSPPPFSYAAVPSNEASSYGTYTGSNPYCMRTTTDLPLYPSYLPPMQQAYSGMATPPIKQEFYGDDEMNPFSMSYASISSIDVGSSHAYHDSNSYPPSLADSFDHHQGESPLLYANFPHTPASMPRTPPMRLYDRS